jgi:uncharacterized protein (TIGR02145 family)
MLPAGQYICGATRVRDRIVLFTTTNTSYAVHGAGRNMIHTAYLDKEDEYIPLLTTIYDDAHNGGTGTLDFSLLHKIKAIGKYETSDIQKVYWTDSVNPLRYMNIASNLTVDGAGYSADNYMAPEMFEVLPLFEATKPELYDIIGGSLMGGMVQYAYQLYKLNGAETAFSPVSDLIHIVLSGDFKPNTLSYEGDIESVKTGKGCKIKIVNNNTGYSRLRLVRIHYSTYNSIPVIHVCNEVEIPTEASIIYISDVGDNINSLTLSEFNINSTELFSCEDIAVKDNRLFAANILKDEFNTTYFDTRAVRFKNGTGLTSDTTGYITITHGISDITFSIHSTEEFDVTINNFSTNYCAGRDVVYVTDFVLDSGYAGLTFVQGTYTSPTVGVGQPFSSIYENTSCRLVSYSSASDILVFRVRNTSGMGYGYFWPDYTSLDTGTVFSLSFTYSYSTGLPSVEAIIRNGELGDSSYSIDTIYPPIDPDDVNDWDTAGWISEETHDYINDFNNPDNDSDTEFRYVYQSDGTTVGAEGPNVKIDFETVSFVLDNSGSDTTFHCASSSASNNSFDNYASPWMDGELSWQRDEVYRLFVVWTDNRGRRSLPSWICDLRMPSLHDADFINSSGATVSPSTLTTYSGSTVTGYMLRPRIYFRKFPDEAINGQIYRVKRERKDRHVVTQAFVVPTYVGDVPYYVNLSSGTNLTTNGVELIKLVSPEINVNKNISIQSNDYLDYVTRFDTSDVASTNDTTTSLVTTSMRTEKLLQNTRVNYSSTTSLSDILNSIAISPVATAYTNDAVIIDGLVYSNYYKVGGAKGCTGMVIHYSNTSWGIEGEEYCVVNYKSNCFGSQYGGHTYEDRLLNISIPCSDIISFTNTWYDIKGGDTFINYFDVSTLLFNSAALLPSDTMTETVYVPLESSINCDLMVGDDCQHRSYDSKVSALRQEYGETQYWTMHDDLITMEFQFNQKYDLYTYNSIYSQQTSVQNAISSILDLPDETDFDCLVKASNIKYNGENSDSWTKFNINEEIEVDSNYGEIKAIYTFMDKLMFWQEDAFGILSVNTRALIQDSTGTELALGSGGVLDRYDYMSNTIGIYDKHSLVQGNGSIYWFYDKDYSIYRYGNGLANLSKDKVVWSWIKGYFEKTPLWESPIFYVHGVYDAIYNEVLFTFYKYSDGTGDTIVFNEQTDQFTSFYDFAPYIYIDYKDGYLSNKVLQTATYSTDIEYGALYNWYAVGTGMLAAAGWRVSSFADWGDLATAVGSPVGGNLKETGYTYWDAPNTGAMNIVNFNARGGGIREYSGGYTEINQSALFWKTDDDIDDGYGGGANYASVAQIVYDDSGISSAEANFSDKKQGSSVRLVRDATEAEQLLDDGTACDNYVGNDGKVYPTVKIGTQVWLAANLAETKYNDDSDIPVVTDNAAWAALVTGAMCYYDNDIDNAYTTVIELGTDYTDSLFLHNSAINPRCRFYSLVENTDDDIVNTYASTIKILYNEDYFNTKVFDNIFYISNTFDEDNDVEQYNITFDRMRCYNDYQNSDWVTLTYPVNIMRRERGWTLVVPRNKVLTDYTSSPDIFDPINIDSGGTKTWEERIRDKYMILDLSFNNLNGVKLIVPFIGVKYRLSCR